MPSNYETFFQLNSFAVVGHSAKKAFPRLTYEGLKKAGRTVYPVDSSTPSIEGDPAYPSLTALPAKVEGVVLEVPPEETRQWVEQAADAGVRDVWIHMKHETPEAVSLAAERGINLRTGTCAVMYLTSGLNAHGIHKWIMQRLGRY